jgi:hypothetical protein
VEAVTQPQGFSPGLAARLQLADGRRSSSRRVSEMANPDPPDTLQFGGCAKEPAGIKVI